MHYKDINNNIYGYKPEDVDVEEISIEEARAISEAKNNTPELIAQRRIAEIKQRLSQIDIERTLPLSLVTLAREAGEEPQAFDLVKLQNLETERKELAAEKTQLEAELESLNNV